MGIRRTSGRLRRSRDAAEFGLEDEGKAELGTGNAQEGKAGIAFFALFTVGRGAWQTGLVDKRCPIPQSSKLKILFSVYLTSRLVCMYGMGYEEYLFSSRYRETFGGRPEIFSRRACHWRQADWKINAIERISENLSLRKPRRPRPARVGHPRPATLSQHSSAPRYY